MPAKHIWRQISAYARSPTAHTIHKTLLSRKSQNPQFLLNFRSDATIHAATTVTAIAGHCRSSIGFILLLKCVAFFGRYSNYSSCCRSLSPLAGPSPWKSSLSSMPMYSNLVAALCWPNASSATARRSREDATAFPASPVVGSNFNRKPMCPLN